MARTDNLTNYLTDVADAIRTKTGSQATIQASNFDTTISNIPASDSCFDNSLTRYTSSGHYISATNTVIPLLVIKSIPKLAIDWTNYSLSDVFRALHNLESVDVSLWDVSTKTSFTSTFYQCTSLKSIDCSAWSLPTSSDASTYSTTQMLSGCTSLKRADLSCFKGSWNITSLVDSCTSLEYLDIRGLDLTTCTGVYTDATYNFLHDVPTTCEIIVADNTQKTFMNTTFPDYTNVKTVGEL